MTTPRLTAEASLGPALHAYSAYGTPAGTTVAPVPGAVAEMGFLDTLGSVFSGVLGKVPCLLGCGIPDAVSIATTCGFDPACWLSKAPAAGLSCIRECLS
ncbi:hypothetical protein [Streptomyces mirabilis]|uniref:hypothetical protein n=1 Tax=Streptomyces mirabilis TaxID=68239 RepID=UPI0033274E6F